MGKIKTLVIGAAALCCPFLAGTGTLAGSALRGAAYYSAGVFAAESAQADPVSANLPQNSPENGSQSEENVGSPESEASGESSETSDASEQIPGQTSEQTTYSPDEPPAPTVQKTGDIIVKNRSEFVDTTDFSQFDKNSGSVYRYNFGRSSASDYITLESGAQIRNCTDIPRSELAAAADELPSLGAANDGPQVLIYHTHTCESFLPFGDSFDSEYPIRSRDAQRNMIAVGDALCEALSERGISVVHDCAVYDYPMYTGAYYRSAETVCDILEEFPSIKIVLDIHRDGICNEDGSLVAPVAEIGGKTAAQFMIIAGCDNGEFDMPNYMENFKLACLLQNCAEIAYPTLARAVLFDYRNYNQSLSNGSLLIEVGSHGNSLDEAVCTGGFLGNIIADALVKLS